MTHITEYNGHLSDIFGTFLRHPSSDMLGLGHKRAIIGSSSRLHKRKTVLVCGGMNYKFFVMCSKKRERTTNRKYQGIAGVSKPTATRELAVLVKAGTLKRFGVIGKGTFYEVMDSERAQTNHDGLRKDSGDDRKEGEKDESTL